MPDAHSAALAAFSDAIAARVAAVAPSLVVVRPRRGPTVSGFIWRAGVVVTAEEALEADEAEVVLADGSNAEATLAGRDPSTDVVILRVEAAQGSAAPLAGDVQPRAGEVAIAVGRRPEGASAHLGIVSLAGGPWRSMRGGRIDARLQLDLRLDPRSEGGLVLDHAGRAFAMAVFGPRRTVLGIPAATIERVADHLVRHGRVRRGYLGLGLQPVRLDDEAAQRLDPPRTRGLMAVRVDPDGPARQAGLLQGDVVTAWDGEPVERLRHVVERLGPDSVGRTATLAILRAGKPTTVSVTIAERPAA
jgi:S1-C subfamily serine protease